MSFSDPLARGAKVWPLRTVDGQEQKILVVVTTLELDPDCKKFKQKLVDQLSGSAREYIAETKAADGYILINRYRDWKK